MLAETLHSDLEHLDGEVGVFLQQSAKVPPHQLQAARAVFGGHRRRADAFFHQGHLAKELAGPHVADPVSVARDFHPALGNEKEPHPRLPLLDNGSARLIDAFLHGPGDELQFLRRQRAEEGHLLEIGQRRSRISHAHPPAEWRFIRRFAGKHPWTVPRGRAEHFSVLVPVLETLIRDYTVAVSVPRVPVRPLAGVRRSVDVVLYRALVLSRVRIFGDVDIGQLTLRSDVRGLPVAQLTVEATVILQQPKINLLQTLTVTLPADASEVFEIGGKRAALVSLRIVDVLLRTAWE